MADRSAVAILLVEDNPLDVRSTLKAAERVQLQPGLEVVTDGQTAIDRLRADGDGDQPRIGLVLLDLNLPGKDGNDVLAEIRASPALATLPVVVLSSSTAAADVVNAYRLGANAYVRKPSDLDDWQRTLTIISEFWLSLAELPGPG